MTLEIRSYQPADRPALIALWQRIFPDDPAHNAPEFMIDNKLKVQPQLLLVAILGGQLVGAVMAGFDGTRGWLHHLAVDSEQRRRGIARQLVQAAEHGLRALGCPKVNLQVRETNTLVIEFYRRIGYAVEERVSMGRKL